MGIRGFVENRGSETTRSKGNCKIQEGAGKGRYSVGNLYRWKELTKKFKNLAMSASGRSEIPKPSSIYKVQQRNRTLVNLGDLFFKKTHGETCERWSKLSAHGVTGSLKVVFSIKLK
jgi:hypothetical protein